MKLRAWIWLVICGITGSVGAQELCLRYNFPAGNWMDEALPIGNGYIGAMFFGGPVTDELQLSEESLWAGGPCSSKTYAGGNKKGSWKYLKEIRALLKKGDKEAAASLAGKYMVGEVFPTEAGDQFGDFGGQQPFGSFLMTLETADTFYTDYSRRLDIGNSVGIVRYRMGDTWYENRYFASYPSRLVIVKYTNNAAGGRNYRLRFVSPHPEVRWFSDSEGLLTIEGKLASNGLPFQGQVWVKTDGKGKMQDSVYCLEGAKNIELYITIASAYKNDYPDYRGNDYREVNRLAVSQARRKDYRTLWQEHRQDYKALFDRVVLDLGRSDLEKLPTDERQRLYSKGACDPGLEALYFQYGRYLLISSSRPGTLPAHLQGRWNHQLNAPWACDYHMNINLQMIYWPAEVTNLGECHLPLIDYIDKLREPGRVTAREYFHARGWSVHTMNNVYGYTAPGWDFYWGYAPNSAAWLCSHLWEHYNFTQDTFYLRETAWPILRETGEFWLDYLVEDTDGSLVSSPSYSPEHGEIAVGAAMDQEIAWDLFTNLLEAAEILGGEKNFRDSIRRARERLSPLRIGKYGQLQEWKEDLDDPRDEHRHLSHLYALYPGHQISVRRTPLWAKAARRSLVYRGEGGTGWSLAWKINFWARLEEGDRSYKMLRKLLCPALEHKGYRNPSGSGSYTNLLCAHPPFQIDGNMGAVAGIAEMLLQSSVDTLDLLPALPVAWPEGKVKGLKARGNREVEMEWKEGLLRKSVITAFASGECVVRYKGESRKLYLKKGEHRTFNW